MGGYERGATGVESEEIVERTDQTGDKFKGGET